MLRPAVDVPHVEATPAPRPRVAMITEGTYPGVKGGVSVWCDHLIRGLPDVEFSLVAIVVNHQVRPVWELPANVVSARLVPFWDRSLDRLDAERRTPRVAPSPWLRYLVSLLCRPSSVSDGVDEVDLFGQALLRLAVELAADGLDPVALGELFIEELRSGPVDLSHGTPSLADGLHLGEMLAHLLRPLLLDVDEVDLVHATANGLCGLVALGNLARRGLPFVLSEHGVYLRERYIYADDEFDGPLVKEVVLRFHRLLCMACYRYAAFVAPVSEFNRRWALALGAAPERVGVIYNGIDPDRFPPAAEPVEPTVNWLGRIDPVKGIETLIRCASLVRHYVPEVKFRLFGEAPLGHLAYLDQLKRMVRTAGLEGTVFFEGAISHPSEAFCLGHVSALSSISEGFPFVVLEAMASSLPVVATDVGGVPEAIGKTGYVVPSRDHEALARSLVHLLLNPSLRRSLGTAARQRVCEQFTLTGMVDAHRRLYWQWSRPRTVDLRVSSQAVGATPTWTTR